jgi:hypothetical protein
MSDSARHWEVRRLPRSVVRVSRTGVHDRIGSGACHGRPLRTLDRRAGRMAAAQAGWGVASAFSTSTVSAGAFWRLERARAGTATAEIPAPNRYDDG